MLVVASDPLAGRPAQAGLLLQSSVLVMIQLLKLSPASLLPHLHHYNHAALQACSPRTHVGMQAC